MKKSVVAIGNFDGVHLGHQQLLMHGKQLAIKKQHDFSILTFSPHPRQVFQPNIAPFRIAPDIVKQNLMHSLIVPDHYEVIEFNEDLKNKTAKNFIDDILISRLNAAVIIVGDNFCFGRGREGTIETLQSCSDFETVTSDLLAVSGEPISSSRIRNYLKNAEINQANALLGWEWFIESEVIHGDKRGRELGYPTANMHFGETLVPDHGIYAVRVKLKGEDEWRLGASNIGIRPMFETAMPMLETFIFDFDGDLYDQTLQVKPVQKIRDEMKFENLDDLKDQMAKDCVVARNILQS